MEIFTMATVLDTPGGKEKALFWLKTLVELIENDQARSDEIEGLTTAEVLALAEKKANEAAANAANLAKGN
jgi:hypothetical protein